MAARIVYHPNSCCGCGVCAGVCPTRAIEMQISQHELYVPQVSSSHCISCGKCSNSCPAGSTNPKGLDVRYSSSVSFDSDIGHFQTIYKGYALDTELRYQASSGGLISALLLHMLRTNIVEAAAVTISTSCGGYGTKVIIARSGAEISRAKGSKYFPVTLNEAVREVRKNEINVCFVALPCQTKALRKAMDCDSILSERIKYVFTLFCGHTPSRAATEYYAESRTKTSLQEVKDLAFRGNGWPGTTCLTLTDERIHNEPFTFAWGTVFGSGLFMPRACFFCSDFFGELSDISFGDAWLDCCAGDTRGTSIAITRTSLGQALIEDALKSKTLTLTPIAEGTIKLAFRKNIFNKKTAAHARRKLFGFSGGLRGSDRTSSSFLCYVHESLRYLKLLAGRSSTLRILILNFNCLLKPINRLESFCMTQACRTSNEE